MAGELAGVAERLLDALDRADADAAIATISADAQGIDEVSRKWMRGSGELITYVRQLIEMAQDTHSEMHDAHEVQWGETGIVTFWLEQDYTLDGERGHVSAPTTYVLRREDGEWKLVLGHSIPLPPEE
jgi:ketosteroid isomerase-like protein